MKTSSILLSVTFLSSAFAAPEPSGKWGKGGKGGKGGKWGKEFTSTYSVVATPKQVVDITDDGDFFYTAGLPVRYQVKNNELGLLTSAGLHWLL